MVKNTNRCSLCYRVNRKVLDAVSTLVTMMASAWTVVTETCFTISVQSYTRANNAKDLKVWYFLTLTAIFKKECWYSSWKIIQVLKSAYWVVVTSRSGFFLDSKTRSRHPQLWFTVRRRKQFIPDNRLFRDNSRLIATNLRLWYLLIGFPDTVDEHNPYSLNSSIWTYPFFTQHAIVKSCQSLATRRTGWNRQPRMITAWE